MAQVVAMRVVPTRKNIRFYQRRLRQARMVARAFQSKHHPCSRTSSPCGAAISPAPTAMSTTRSPLRSRRRRCSPHRSSCSSRHRNHYDRGGEPLLHPDLDEILRAIRSHDIIATIITNGYLLTPERIERLNRAGLEHLQISVDNVNPDDVSKKSLKVLDRKLEWLQEYADFDININSVLGGGIPHPEDALTITRRALALGFETTVGVIHDHGGQLRL